MQKGIIILFIILNVIACKAQTNSLVSTNKSLQSIIDSLHLSNRPLKIVIIKSRYELSVWSDTLELKRYPVVFGGNPKDDKLMEGDECTPEGTFKIRSKYPHQSWSKFIWLNYPTSNSWKKHHAAKQKGIIANNASIGGEIGIHGVPAHCDNVIDLKQNWTLGCISLKNKDINELYEAVDANTVIEIKK